jgi:ribosomal protein S18 acetylase RimI-like enzyme
MKDIKYDIMLFNNKELKKEINMNTYFIKDFIKNLEEYRNVKKLDVSKFLEERYKDYIPVYIILLINQKVISFARLNYKGINGYINMVYTNPKYRQKGYASIIMKILMNTEKIKKLKYRQKEYASIIMKIERNIEKIKKYQLEVLKSNKCAIKFYEKLGFKIIEKIKSPYLMEYVK